MSCLVLVVDDEIDVAELFRQQFRRDLRAGRFALRFAHSAAEALEVIASADAVDLILILSDVNMPGMSGIDLIPRARAVRPNVPIVIITAYGDGETRRLAEERGASALLVKPIDFAAVRAEIDLRIGAVP